MTNKSFRPARIAELLKEELSEIINYELADRRIRSVTITHIKLSSDLRHARVWASVSGPPQDIADTIRRLNRAAGFIRSQLYPRLSLRYVPQLFFQYDDALEKAERLEKLFAEGLSHPLSE